VTEDSARPLGEWLRQRREELGISLEQAQADTRIRVRYLEALEAEDFESLPNPVVGRGFLRNYAAYLELDPQDAADRYSGVAEPAEPEPLPANEPSSSTSEPFRPVSLHEMPGRRSRGWLLVGLVVIILVAALGLLAWQGYPYVTDWLSTAMSAANPEPTPRPTNQVLTTATHTPTVTAVKTAPTATSTPTQPAPTLELTLTPTLTPSLTPTPTQPVYTGIFLELVFTDTSWIQVTVDGVRQFQGELAAGTHRSWYGEERIELRVGNAGVVDVTVNGQKLGALGEPGEVVDRVFEIVDDQVSEATVTPAPTEPTSAPEPGPTATVPLPTVTATASPTATVPIPAVTPTASP
jgi:cytoskeletal protein RodZ